MNAQSLDEPLPTLTANGNHVALVEPVPFVIGTGGPEYAGKPVSVDAPFKTLLTNNRKAVIEPVIEPFFFAHQRRGNAPQSVDEPMQTLTATSSDFALVDATDYVLPQHSGGELRPVSKPVPTIATGGAISVVETLLIDINHGLQNGKDGNRAQRLEDPLSTVTTKRGKGLIEPIIVNIDHGSSDGSPKPLDYPIPTQTSKARTAIVEPCLVKYNGTATANSVDDPLHTVSTKDRFALVTTEEGTFALDIRLRMLKTHELAAAMSMKGYVFHGKMEEQVKQIGNAVPTETAKALISEVLQ